MNEPGAQTALQVKGWFLLGALLLGQYLLFRQHAQQEIVWAYPRNCDQLNYLSLSFDSYELIKEKGLNRGLKAALKTPAETGIMLHLQAACLYLLGGPSRLTALTLNFAYFALLQVVLVGTVLWLTRRWSLALFALGLLLTALSPFFWAGGMMDFRIDFIAFCLFGTFLSLVIRSGLFASRPWSLAVGAVTALCILFRFLTATYLVAVLGSFFAVLVARTLLCRASAARAAARGRLLNLLAAGLLVTAVTAPGIWAQREGLYHHYVKHVECSENEVRQREFGVRTTRDRLLYYPRSVAGSHAGRKFLILAGVALAVAAVLGRVRRGLPTPGAPEQAGGLAGLLLTAGACVGLPLAVLTAYPSPSPVVGGIVVPCLVWVVVLGVAGLAGLFRASVPQGRLGGLGALACVSLLCGASVQVGQYSRRAIGRQDRASVEQLLALSDTMALEAQRVGWQAPTLAADQITDGVVACCTGVSAYERQRAVLRPAVLMPISVMQAPSEAQALALLRQSDFVILTTRAGTADPGPYPFNQVIAALRPRLISFCERSLVCLGRYQAFGQEVSLYMRPTLGLTGDSGGWVTSNGLTLTGPTDVLRTWPVIELRGRGSFEHLGRLPGARAELTVGRSPPAPVRTRFTVSEGEYCLRLEPETANLPEHAQVQVRVTFDCSFVASELGRRADKRRLVLPTPRVVSLFAPRNTARASP